MPAAENPKSDGHHQHSRKFLYLFRFRHRKKSGVDSSQGSSSSPEERRKKLDHDMRTNWDELPATLRRRKEKLSQAVLDQFHSDDAVIYGETTRDGGGTTVVVRAEVNAEQADDQAGEESSASVSEDSLERGVRRNGSLKKLGKVLEPVGDQELSLDELKKLKEGLQEVLQSGIEPEQAQECRENFEKEERDVIKLLSRAVSEDSLLIVSSDDEGQSSEPEDDVDDGEHSKQDSGTDVNTPSNCSSCGEEIFSIVYDETRISSDDTSVDKKSSDCSSVVEPDVSEIISPHARVIESEKGADQCESNFKTSDLPESEDKFFSKENDYATADVLRVGADNCKRESSKEKSQCDRLDAITERAIVPVAERPSEDDRGWEVWRSPQALADVRFVNEVLSVESCSCGSNSPDSDFGQTYVSFDGPGRDLYSRVQIPRVARAAGPLYDAVTGAPWCRQSRRPLESVPHVMTPIAEEEVEEDLPCPQMSVQQILKKFEELSGRMCPSGGDTEEKSATLREIQETLRCLEEKVRHYESTAQLHQKGSLVPRLTAENFQQGVTMKSTPVIDNWTGAAVRPHHGPPQHRHVPPGPVLQPHHSIPPEPAGHHDGKHSLLQFAMLHFRQSPEKFEMLKAADGSISGSLKVIESMKSKKNNKGKKANKENDWTWKEQVSMVKFTPVPIEQSLLRLETIELSDLAVECFQAVMRYMGDYPMTPDITEVKCVYTILMHCHKHESLRDEVYCQLMKQTTNNKSSRPDSCQRGWRLFSIVAAYFVCSDTLKPYLFKYLETAAYDKRRAYHGTATVCLQNLRKTFKYGGRKNVPSVEEITAISAGRNSKRQIYRLPGGTERVVNTKSTTVVQDVIEEMCSIINVQSGHEMEEFSLYCIVEGDTFTMPLAREEYVLDVTTELHKNQQVFYLIFCRSVWHFPLRLDSPLYIEVVFNQIAPDYLEGLLLVMPGEQLEQDAIYDIAKIAALLHRAADMTHLPTMKETKFLLPKPALSVRDVKPPQWVNMVQGNWRDVEGLQTIQAKAQVLDILSKWPLFGSSFFAVKRISDPKERSDHILALNRHGVHFIDLVTHETLIHYPYSEVISTRKVKSEDGTLFLDMKCGNLMQQRITRLQTDQAHEISRLIRQYITMEQRLRS